jgi:serine/threonine protein kinase
MSSPLRRVRSRTTTPSGDHNISTAVRRKKCLSSAIGGGCDGRRGVLLWGGLIGCIVMSFQTIVYDSLQTTGRLSTVYKSFHERNVDPTSLSTITTDFAFLETVTKSNHTLVPQLSIPQSLIPRVIRMPTTYMLEQDRTRAESIFVVSPLTESLPMEDNEIFFQSNMTETKTSTQAITIYRKFEKEWLEECASAPLEGGTDTDKSYGYKARPTCNDFHELPLADNSHVSDDSVSISLDYLNLLSMEGSWRSVWNLTRLSTTAGNNRRDVSSVVLKLLQLHREFDRASFAMHEMDAMVMERLTASPYIVNSYGYCGQSVMSTLASASGRKLIKDDKLKWLKRIQLARDLARGLADLHALSPLKYDRNTARKNQRQPLPLVFAHHDINIANTLATSEGHLQWNDFNLGVTRRYKMNPKTGSLQPCFLPIRYQGALWRSPEEILNVTGYLDSKDDAMQAADVYSLGNVLFQVLSKHQPWSHLEKERVQDQELDRTNVTVGSVRLATGQNFTQDEKNDSLLSIARAKVQGMLPFMPQRFLSRPEAKLLWTLIQKCYQRDPSDRTTAWDLAIALGKAYDEFDQKVKNTPKEKIKT